MGSTTQRRGLRVPFGTVKPTEPVAGPTGLTRERSSKRSTGAMKLGKSCFHESLEVQLVRPSRIRSGQIDLRNEDLLPPRPGRLQARGGAIIRPRSIVLYAGERLRRLPPGYVPGRLETSKRRRPTERDAPRAAEGSSVVERGRNGVWRYRVLRTGHPERKKRVEFIKMVVEWLKQH